MLKRTSIALLVISLLFGGNLVLGATPSQGVIGQSGQVLTKVTTYAGDGKFEMVDGVLTASSFRTPQSLLVQADGSVLVTDSQNHLIRKISGGKTSTFAGITLSTNSFGFPVGALIDDIKEEAVFNAPDGIAADALGNIYIADAKNHAIRKISKAGEVSTLAGNGVRGNVDGKGKAASFNHPQDIAVAADGTLYVADTLNHVIRKITKDGTVTTLNAPSERGVEIVPGAVEETGNYLDGDLAKAQFNEPASLILDSTGNLFVSDAGNQRIRYIDLKAKKVTTVAGGVMAEDKKTIYEPEALYAQGDYVDGDALKAMFNFPLGLALTREGGLIIADSLNHAIRYLYKGKVTTIAGDVELSSGNLNGIDRNAQLHKPTDVAIMADDSILVADAYNNTIRRIELYSLPSSLPVGNTIIKVVYGQQVIVFDTKPEISNSRTMVPVSAITTALGYTNVWVGSTKTVKISKGDITLELVVGMKSIKIVEKGQTDIIKATDAGPYIKNKRTYVPLRYLEELGIDVQWHAGTKTVILRAK